MNKIYLQCEALLFLSSFLLLSLFSSCDQSNTSNENLPVARGGVGEIMLVMDSASWKGAVGEEIRNIFRAPIPGLPQDEPMYTLRYINPFALNSVLRNSKNLIFVTTMEGQSQADRKLRSYFTKESLEQIRNNPELFMHTKQDEFARGQEIMHLFGQDQDALLANLKENPDQIRNFFDEAESKRLKKTLFVNEEKGIKSALAKEHNFSIRVPFGYDIAKNKDNFVWIRQLGRETDKSIFVAYRDYDSEGLFTKDSIINLREEVAKAHIFDARDTSLYVTTQRIAPVDTAVVNFNGHYAVKARGLWKLTDNSLGGPFVSYTLVDEKLNRLYYIEGFVSSPGQDKRNFVKELEAILSTFKPGCRVIVLKFLFDLVFFPFFVSRTFILLNLAILILSMIA